jgi:hypothetical protein
MNDVAGGEGWGPTSTWIAADEISLIELGRSTVSASVEKEPER